MRPEGPGEPDATTDAKSCASVVIDAMTETHDHHHTETERWKHDGVRVIPGNQLDPNVPSTPGMDRKAAINFARTGAQKLWAGQ